MGAFAWVVIHDDRRCGRGRSGEFFLPEKVAELVRGGVELGEADDRVFSRNNSKQGNGAIGLLTNDIIDRKSLYIPAVIFALIPFANPELYP
jgi:non-canonical (house-cleaning) NTP pyrophosphatase